MTHWCYSYMILPLSFFLGKHGSGRLLCAHWLIDPLNRDTATITVITYTCVCSVTLIKNCHGERIHNEPKSLQIWDY